MIKDITSQKGNIAGENNEGGELGSMTSPREGCGFDIAGGM
jgi:hypothetical protein